VMAEVKPVLHHVTFKTTRLNEMIEWYGKVVGMVPNFRDGVAAWMTNDEANHRVALLAVPGIEDDPNKIPHAGMHHLAFEFPSIEHVLKTYVRLKDEGITPHAALDHGLTTSLYYVDPDGK
jgi:catechol 2,3-dioxygenase